MSNNDIAKEIIRKHQKEYALRRLLNLPVEKVVPLFSEWAEENRYIPEGVSPYYGQFDPMGAPHLIEPLNRLHPDDPCTHVTMMKSVQSWNTTTIAENALGAYIKYKLGSILFLTSTKGMASIRGSANIDTLIDNANLAELLKPMSNRTGKKNKDNSLYKEFDGGIKLLLSSYGSTGDLKSNTWNLIICDEWDEAPPEVKGQGDIAGVIEGRTKSLRHFKILNISTPSSMETSRVYKSFMEGDQREYFVPCPLCGEPQILKLKGKGEDYGLTFTRERDKQSGVKVLIPNTVRYTCRICKEDFMESKKQWMLENGVWKPQAVARDVKKHSYHSTGLIAPETGLSWESICQSFIDTDFGDDIPKFKDFTINSLGNAWANIRMKSSWEDFKDRAEHYTRGEVPGGSVENYEGEELYRGPLICTGGCDVQGDRLELQIICWGYGMESWQIDFQIFYGNPSNSDDVCWSNLNDFVYNQAYTICGKKQRITMTAIDTGYDPKIKTRQKDFTEKRRLVYDFVSYRPDRFIAIMGVNSEKTDGFMKEARTDHKYLTKRYNLATGIMKEVIVANIENASGPRAIHFPKFQLVDGIKTPIENDHYKQFLSERYQEKEAGKYGWVKIYKRNEVLDTWIYSRAAAEFYGIHAWSAIRWAQHYYDLKVLDDE